MAEEATKPDEEDEWTGLLGGRRDDVPDPASQRIVKTIRAPALPGGGDVVQIEDSVWATEHDEATLVELRAAGP